MTPQEAVDHYKRAANRLRPLRGAPPGSRRANEAREGYYRAMKNALDALRSAGLTKVVSLLEQHRELLNEAGSSVDETAKQARRRTARALDRQIRTLLTAKTDAT